MSSSKAIQNRGFGLDPQDFDQIGFVLVRAGVAEASQAVAQLKNSQVCGNAWGKKLRNNSWVVFQIKDNPWSLLVYHAGEDRLPSQLSRSLDCEVLYYFHEDTAGWTSFSYYRSGEKVETFTFGLDYSEDFEEFGEEMGQSTDDGKPWDFDLRRDGEQFLFRSECRKVEESELLKVDEFLDECFRARDAWLPPAGCIPSVGPKCQAEDLALEDFIAVTLVSN